MFITFEGIDNSGKTTAAKALVRSLNILGYEAIFTREPGGTKIGEQLRQLVLNNNELSQDTRALILNAVRIEHVETVIKPALEDNKIVVCDRYIDSTVAYQYAQGWDMDVIHNLNYITTKQGKYMPDLTFWLDIPVEVAQSREDDGISFNANTEYLRQVNNNYKWWSECNMSRIKRIDATENEITVNKLIWLVVAQELGI